MHVLLDVVSPMRSLIAISIVKSGIYQIRAIAMNYIELYFVVYFLRLIICPRFNRHFNLVDKIHVVIEVYIGNVCKNIPRVRCR